MNGHIEMARMLVGEYNANVDFQSLVRALVCVSVMREHMFKFSSGCVHDSGRWECRCCRHMFFVFVTIFVFFYCITISFDS